MSFFNEDRDPFEEILSEFFGRQSSVKNSDQVNSEAEKRVTDYIEEEKSIYFIFELAGFRKEDISLKLDGKELIVFGRKKKLDDVKNYLKEKLSEEINFKKIIPVKVEKKFSFELKNGLLEVELKRK